MALLAFAPGALHACATCFGASDSKMAQGMNMGIYTLLIVVAMVLGGILAASIGLVVRNHRMAADPADVEPADPTAPPGDSTAPR
jgi:hypothetical protein